MGIILALALLALSVVLLIRDIRPSRAPLIFLLRGAMVVLLSLVLVGFVLRRTVRVRPKTDLLVLVDESQSMNTGKKLSELTDVLHKLPNETNGTSAFRIAYLGFGDTVRRLSEPREAEPKGKRTDFVSALKTAGERSPGAVLIISDGEHNAVGDPAQTATELEFPIYAIGIGQTAGRDVAIGRIRGTSRAVAGDTISLVVRVGSTGLGAERVRIRLLDNEKPVAAKDVVLTGEESRQEVEFRVTASTEGRHIYRVRADSIIGEENYVNNQAQTAIVVLPSRTRAVYLTNRPGFNTRFLLHLLGANRDIELIPLVALSGERLLRITERGMAPYSLSGVDADVMVLDNIAEDVLGIGTAISTFAANRGLLVLAGEGFQPGRSLASLLPLEPTASRIPGELQPVLTEASRGNPVLFAGERNLVAELPPFRGAVRSKGVRADAQVWAKSEDETSLIAFRRNGEGKVLYIAGYPLWRAGFSTQAKGRRSDDLSQLLSNMIRFLALKDVDRFRLSADKLDYYEGEPVAILLQATREDGRPWSGLDVRLKIAPEQHTVDSIQHTGRTRTNETTGTKTMAVMVERGNGLYEAVLNGMSSGRYRAQAEVFVQEQSQGTVLHSFSVSELSLELSQTGLNAELLQRITQVTGGEYRPAGSLGVKGLDFRFAEYRRQVTLAPRLNRYVFLAIALLFIAEVFLRKRRGMS